MDFKKDYYIILQIKETASKEELKAAYRKLAVKYHPDKNPGNKEAEEHFKLVNEANEILSNEILRNEYDEYRKAQREWERAQQESSQQQSNQQQSASKNQRSYERKKQTVKETRIYVKGKVSIKYWADPEDDDLPPSFSELKYQIHPTEAILQITETNIHPVQGIPLDYLRAFKESDLFRAPVPQPVQCVVQTDSGEETYALELKDIRIKNICLQGVTKHESISYGTLVGDLYAYSPRFETIEQTEMVTECFGETGRRDTKQENGFYYHRKEYYNADCSTYWSDWFVLKKPKATKQPSSYSSVATSNASGCLQWWWLPLALFFLLRYPAFLGMLIAMVAIGILFSLASSFLFSFRRILPALGILLLGYMVFSALRFGSGGSSFIQMEEPSYDSIHTTKTVRKKKGEKTSSDTSSAPEDTLISHYIRWKDYENKSYEATFSVAIPDVRSSVAIHNNLDPVFTGNNLAPAYAQLLKADENKLQYIYNALDSIRATNNLDEAAFANLIVSCVQSIPYFLVLERDCADEYDEEFTRNYLASCERDCCIGYEKFGVRSPVEFLSDLKGDCDTRSLLLFQLLSHYKYNVALLSSVYYRHAVIAVHLPGQEPAEGLAMNIHNRNYYLWETTNTGFTIGSIPAYMNNLRYWNIDLLNENN